MGDAANRALKKRRAQIDAGRETGDAKKEETPPEGKSETICEEEHHSVKRDVVRMKGADEIKRRKST